MLYMSVSQLGLQADFDCLACAVAMNATKLLQRLQGARANEMLGGLILHLVLLYRLFRHLFQLVAINLNEFWDS